MPEQESLVVLVNVDVETKKPFVSLIWGDKRGDMLPTEARSHALDILEAAEAAETDGFLWYFLENQPGLNLTLEAKANFLAAFREYRDIYMYQDRINKREVLGADEKETNETESEKGITEETPDNQEISDSQSSEEGGRSNLDGGDGPVGESAEFTIGDIPAEESPSPIESGGQSDFLPDTQSEGSGINQTPSQETTNSEAIPTVSEETNNSTEEKNSGEQPTLESSETKTEAIKFF